MSSRSSKYETYGDVNQGETYDAYVHHRTKQPESYTSKWQAPITFMKQNKLFVFVLIFASFAFGALVVGLSVGLSTVQS